MNVDFVNYPIQNLKELQEYSVVYISLVVAECRRLKIDIRSGNFSLDHLGLQVLAGDDYDRVDAVLKTFSVVQKEQMLHGRRNSLYFFHEPIGLGEFTLPGIEIFEPRPGTESAKLKLGIQHAAFTVKSDFAEFLHFAEQHLPFAKKADYGDGMFFKTVFCNNVEIEFRDAPLIRPSEL